jgi:hypothetical protein
MPVLAKNAHTFLSNLPDVLLKNVINIEIKDISGFITNEFMGLGVYKEELSGLGMEDYS